MTHARGDALEVFAHEDRKLNLQCVEDRLGALNRGADWHVDLQEVANGTVLGEELELHTGRDHDHHKEPGDCEDCDDSAESRHRLLQSSPVAVLEVEHEFSLRTGNGIAAHH